MKDSFISVDQVTAFENQLYTTVSLGNIWKFYWIWQLSSSLAIGCVLSTLYKFPISILNSTLAELVFYVKIISWEFGICFSWKHVMDS
jgi:hypothetical protein